MRTGFDTLVTTPLDMSLNTTPCVSCGRCAETCPTGALMPKPRVLEKYDVDESRCILCGICVDACPYDALRCGPDFELSHESRADPMIDLMAISAMDRDTEISYVRRERDWAVRARRRTGAASRIGRQLPMLPPGAVARQRPRGIERTRPAGTAPPPTATAARTHTTAEPWRCPPRSRTWASPGMT